MRICLTCGLIKESENCKDCFEEDEGEETPQELYFEDDED